MRTQTAYKILGLLYLAGTLAIVSADVDYNGTESVRIGSPWTISCTGFQGRDDIYWTKNGAVPEGLNQKSLFIDNDEVSWRYTNISSKNALELHEGTYKCARSSNKTFRLIITTDEDVEYKVILYGEPHVLEDNKFKLIEPVAIQCGNSTSKDVVEWTKDGVQLKLLDARKMYRLNESRVLEVLRNDPDVIGNYTCINKNQSFSLRFRVVPFPIPKFSEGFYNAVEGEKLSLTCGGDLYPGIKIEWTFNNIKFDTTEGRFILSRDLERGIKGAVLTVTNMQMNDSGLVSCRVYYEGNEKHNRTAKAEIKVKDKLAALWPFLGICAEVVVLCAIILIYEKKRNKAELEESDTDQSPDTKPTPNKDSDVRQRK